MVLRTRAKWVQTRDRYLQVVQGQGSRISCKDTRRVGYETMKCQTNSLRDPPKPQTVWYITVSSTTISAEPMTLGVVKLIGTEDLSDVNNFERSHVVCHYGQYSDNSVKASHQNHLLYPRFPVKQRDVSKRDRTKIPTSA